MEASKAPSLDCPSELSTAEYADLLEQIRTEFTVEASGPELLYAARYDDIDVVRGILNVHPTATSFVDTSGNTALHMAAANGHAPIVELLLSVDATVVTTVNQAGNTALHWSAINGHSSAVKLLLQQKDADVLVKNGAGRSALTEGFSSTNTDVVQLLLEHESASEEKLMATSDANAKPSSDNGTDIPDNPSIPESITHDLTFGNPRVSSLRVRELAMATSAQDSILGQTKPDDDTTGFGIWASSLVTAAWCVDEALTGVILELGAGVGVPGLAVAATAASDADATTTMVYVTDFNVTAVENLEYNIELNEMGGRVGALRMNWQDESTWPTERVDTVIGSDLIYQSDMVPLLLQTLEALKPARFLYVAPTTGRQGHDEFLARMVSRFEMQERPAPAEYSRNPLASQDDEECFVHFHELSSAQFVLYDFRWKYSSTEVPWRA